MRKRGEPFEPGTTVHNREILRIIDSTKPAIQIQYIVKAVACGHEYEMNHKCLLDKRMANSQGWCPQCARKRSGAVLHARGVVSKEEAKRDGRKSTGRPPHPDREETLEVHSLWKVPGR